MKTISLILFWCKLNKYQLIVSFYLVFFTAQIMRVIFNF